VKLTEENAFLGAGMLRSLSLDKRGSTGGIFKKYMLKYFWCYFGKENELA